MAEHNDPPQEPTLPSSKRKSDLDLQDLPSKIPKLDLKENDDKDLQNDHEGENDEREEDRKGKGIMRDDKGKGKMILEEEEDDDDDDDSDDGGDSDDDGSDFSDDPLMEVDLNNILPSRTRGRTASSGVRIDGDSGNAAAAASAAGISDDDSDSDDSDAWFLQRLVRVLEGNRNGLVLLLTSKKKEMFLVFSFLWAQCGFFLFRDTSRIELCKCKIVFFFFIFLCLLGR